jgi:hypothetical protein
MNYTSTLIVELDEPQLKLYIGGIVDRPPRLILGPPVPTDIGAGAEASAAGGGSSFAAAMGD